MGKGEAGEGGLGQLLLGLVSHYKMEALSSGIVKSFKPKNRERFVTSITAAWRLICQRESERDHKQEEWKAEREAGSC